MYCIFFVVYPFPPAVFLGSDLNAFAIVSVVILLASTISSLNDFSKFNLDKLRSDGSLLIFTTFS